LEIIFIGTGSGKTSIKRNHSSIFIKSQKENLLIDAGDGISKALLQNKIDFLEIKNIVITHFHADHFAGLASLITQMKLMKRKTPLKIFVHENLVYSLKNFLSLAYLFPQAMNFTLKLIGFDSNKKIKVKENFFFTAKQNTHIANNYNVNFPEENFISLSLLLRINNKNIFYTSDIGSPDDLYLFKNIKIDLMISEITHVTFDEIYSAFKLLNPRMLFLTHIEDEKGQSILGKIKSLKKNEKNRVILCYDGLKLVR